VHLGALVAGTPTNHLDLRKKLAKMGAVLSALPSTPITQRRADAALAAAGKQNAVSLAAQDRAG